jgi:hypothetical protein
VATRPCRPDRQPPLADGHPDAGFYRAKLATARFYADHILPRATALAETVQSGAPGVLALEEDRF